MFNISLNWTLSMASSPPSKEGWPSKNEARNTPRPRPKSRPKQKMVMVDKRRRTKRETKRMTARISKSLVERSIVLRSSLVDWLVGALLETREKGKKGM